MQRAAAALHCGRGCIRTASVRAAPSCAARWPLAAGAFWGVDNIKPGDVLDLDVDQMEALLKATTLNGGSKVRGRRGGGVCGKLHAGRTG